MIVKLQGGLANQMFQFAFGHSVALARNEEVFFDRSSFATDPLRHYELDAYDLPIEFKTHTDEPVYREKSLLFDPEVYNVPRGTYFDGYWQNERYLNKDVARAMFWKPKGYGNDPCREIARHILSVKDSCFIGVRRADYLWPERINYHGVMDVNYYREAMSKLPFYSFLNTFIFTDDIPWTIDHLGSCGEIVDVNGPNEKAWDIWLGSLCKNAIIGNSTFHWWQAWLGPDKNGGTIVAPSKWFANGMPNEVVPARWKTI